MMVIRYMVNDHMCSEETYTGMYKHLCLRIIFLKREMNLISSNAMCREIQHSDLEVIAWYFVRMYRFTSLLRRQCHTTAAAGNEIFY